MKRFLARRWFLLVLIVLLAIGFGAAPALHPAIEGLDHAPIVALVIFCMAFPLDADAMWSAIRRPGGTLLALGVNLLLLPPAAYAASLLLPPSLAPGLVIAGCIPSTLASSAVLTRRAGGADSIPLLVMMITNLSCFLVAPAWLAVLTTTSEAAASFGDMALGLATKVVAPVVAAQLLRQVRPIGRWATANKTPLGVVAQVGLLTVVLLGAINSGVRLRANDALATVTAGDWVVMPVVVVALHVVALAATLWGARRLALSPEDSIAAAFAGSQKTLMVGLQIALDYFPTAPILPLVIYHVGQLIVDSFVADAWQGKTHGAADAASTENDASDR